MAADRVTGKTFATRSEVIARHGMVASSHPLATQIGLQVLKDGGSAVDAAIATNAALGLMEPTGNGIGGDLFAIVWDAESHRLYGLNASGRSPMSLSLEWFIENGYESIPSLGPLPVSVPGAVDGWFELHKRFGRLPMAAILQPTIDYARNGHPVAELIAWGWGRSVPRLQEYPGFTEQFTIDGRAPRKGEIWKNPNLANTLERIAREGRDVFYKGDMARVMSGVERLLSNENVDNFEGLLASARGAIDDAGPQLTSLLGRLDGLVDTVELSVDGLPETADQLDGL
ncbi:MAG: gamma-glutamyltransferase, partial [Xanthomonadales bacterium]|nr:gamma-glutamyltransferase [Xanthomonadales bacterium]